MDQEKNQRDSKEFRYPDDNLLHKRRPSAPADHSATQSEDDESSISYEVSYLLTYTGVHCSKPVHVPN